VLVEGKRHCERVARVEVMLKWFERNPESFMNHARESSVRRALTRTKNDDDHDTEAPRAQLKEKEGMITLAP